MRTISVRGVPRGRVRLWEYCPAEHLGGSPLLTVLRVDLYISGDSRVTVTEPFLSGFEIAARASVQDRSTRVAKQMQSSSSGQKRWQGQGGKPQQTGTQQAGAQGRYGEVGQEEEKLKNSALS